LIILYVAEREILTQKFSIKTSHCRFTALAAGALSLLAVTTPVETQAAEDGIYLEGRAGISLPRDSELDSATTNQDIDLDRGFVGNLAVGHGYGKGFRSEFELGYRENDVDSISSGGGTTGDVSAWSFMGNAVYDFNLSGPLQPYIGAGLGVARLDASGASQAAGVNINDTDTAFAWQAMVGVAYALNENMKLTLGYRYFAVPDASFSSSAGTSFDSDYASHDVLFGFRYSFRAPKKAAEPKPQPVADAPLVYEPPPPPPPALPPVARNFLVFFDFNQSTITQVAQNIIGSAAEASQSLSSVKLRLTGHADRAGPTRYNQRLSIRRANVVKAALVRLGVASKDIAILGKGESEPLVQTADGIREPQNRRVQIILE
jgi:OOP family OmpA-OmpF porin